MVGVTMKKYDIAVFIGRFQPFHIGHMKVIERALAVAENVLILIGSIDTPRSYRNPFTYDERVDMIADTFQVYRGRMQFTGIQDYTYNDTLWIEQVQYAVEDYSKLFLGLEEPKIALIGHNKDNTSFYLKLFPQWDSIEVESDDNISGTNIRDLYFSNYINFGTMVLLPKAVMDFLFQFMETTEYKNIAEDYLFVDKYKSAWSSAPYEPIFVTVDACIIQSGHILLIKRKARPGKDLWALPGGFLKPDEKIIDGMIRELREETKIKVPVPVLKGSIKKKEVFDDPNRSSRGRTITHAFLIELPPDVKLPEVKGSDDAKRARWWPLNMVKNNMMFEDHISVIQNLTGNI
jgi:bifunctional NMN adenylyltransferase/nudix hydrolase